MLDSRSLEGESLHAKHEVEMPVDPIGANVNGYSPLYMQYLGGKGRIADWVLQAAQSEFMDAERFVDLFAGTGVVSLKAQRAGFRVLANDLQPYSATVLRSLLRDSRHGLLRLADEIEELLDYDRLLAGGREDSRVLLEKEQEHFAQSESPTWDWESYADFCEATELIDGGRDSVIELRKRNRYNLFVKYYANTYFGVRQCLELDLLREFAKTLDAVMSNHLLASAVATMTHAVSSTTHLAQYLRPTTQKRAEHLIRRRQQGIIVGVADRLRKLGATSDPDEPAVVMCTDFRVAMQDPAVGPRTIVYADPPYFKEHYSRYYHVLDTFVLYDFPTLTYNSRIGATTIGRYRDGRLQSDFGKRSAVGPAFRELLEHVKSRGAKLAISYAETSLLSRHELEQCAQDVGLKCSVVETTLRHSGQGQPRHRDVVEYLFLIQ